MSHRRSSTGRSRVAPALAALALVVAALVAFQMYSHRVKEDQRSHQPDVQVRAQREMFQAHREEHSIKSDQLSGVNRDDGA